MERRVVITGLGAITPIGNNVNETWKGIENKECGIDNISLFDSINFKTSLCAEVKDYNPLDYFEPKQAKRLDRSSQFALIAAREAVKNSGITLENTDFKKVGVFVSTGIGGLITIQSQCEVNYEKGNNRVNFQTNNLTPFEIIGILEFYKNKNQTDFYLLTGEKKEGEKLS